MLALRTSPLYRQTLCRRLPFARSFSSRRSGNDDEWDFGRSSKRNASDDNDDEWDRSSKKNTRDANDDEWNWEKSSRRITRDRKDDGWEREKSSKRITKDASEKSKDKRSLSAEEKEQIAREEADQIIESCKNGILMVVNATTALDFDPEIPSTAMKELKDLIADPKLCTDKTNKIVASMKNMQPRQLRQMYHKEYEYNQAVEYWENFMTEGDPTLNGAKPCLFTFQGDLWRDMSPLSRSKKALMYLQENLRILDPVYGVLKPLDRIQPYKLDMHVDYALGYFMSLRDFWSETINNVLRQELEKKPECMILNCCDQPFSNLIDREKLPKHCRLTTVQGNQVAGKLISYIAEKLITDPENIISYKVNKLEFQSSKSTPEHLVWDVSNKQKSGQARRFASHPSDE